MVKTVFICDKCNKYFEQNTNGSWPEQPCVVALYVSFGSLHVSQSFTPPDTQQWCRTCVMSVGLREPRNDEDRKVAPTQPLSFEDRVVELIEELGFTRQ